MNTKSIKAASAVTLAILIASCDAGSFLEPGLDDGPGDPPAPAEVSSLVLNAASTLVTEADTVHLTVTALDTNGEPIADPLEIEWSSSDETVASFESTSLGEADLLAQQPGTTTVTASYEEMSTSTTIEVHRRPVDLVYVSGSGQRGDPGTELVDSLAVRIIDKRGDAVSGVQLSFVVASGGGTVSPQAGTTDSEGRLSAAWTLGAAWQQVVEARVSAAQARVKQVKDSVVVFTAQFTDEAAEAQVASVTVSPASDTVESGSTRQLHAAVRDGDGNELTDRSVTWSSSDPTVATVDNQGVVTGMAKGEIAAVAKVDGVSGTADIMVAEPTDGTLTISPPTDTLYGVGDRATLTVEAQSADGSVISDPDVEWSSQDTTIATVDSMGTVTAQALGVAVIAATAVCCDSGDFVEVTVVDDTTSVDATAPGTVTDPSVVAVGEDFVTLEWTQVDDGTGGPADYALRFASPDLDWGSAYDTEVTVEGTAVGNTITYTFDSLAGGTDYEFGLVAYRGTIGVDVTFGDLSNFAAARTLGGPLTSGTAYAYTDSARVTLSATAAVGGTSPYTYQWHRDTSRGFLPDGGNALTGFTSLNETDTGLTNGTTYYYVLVATDDDAASVEYDEVDATPSVAPAPGEDEPVYDPEVHTLIYEDDMDSYTNVTDMGALPASTRIAPHPSPVSDGNSVETDYHSVITGRGGTGKALRMSYSGANDDSWGSKPTFRIIDSPSNSAPNVNYFQFWARVSSTGDVATQPTAIKWFEAFHDVSAGSRIQWNTHKGFGNEECNRDLHPTWWMVIDGNETGPCASMQPVGPHWEDLVNAGWFRTTYSFKPHTSEGANDGFARMWINGIKIIDISAETVGVTPPGGEKVWCTQTELEGLAVDDGIGFLAWGSNSTNSTDPFDFDIDDLIWWTN